MSKLPEGWRIESLHYTGDRQPRRGNNVSDRQIAEANSIRISYTPTGASKPTAYRMVHGAPDRDTLGDLIDRVVTVASPVAGE